jgi:hypothetical protein
MSGNRKKAFFHGVPATAGCGQATVLAVEVEAVEQRQPGHVVQAAGVGLGAFREVLDQLPPLPLVRVAGVGHALVRHAASHGHVDVTRPRSQRVHEDVDQEPLVRLLEQGVRRENG